MPKLALLLFVASLVSEPALAEVRIGLAAPITGPDAVFGTELRNGVQQAVHDINTQGGILGQHLVLSIGDDVSDPKRGVAVANKFIAAKVSLVIGDFNSTVTLPASEIYSDHAVLDITPASTNPQVTERGLDFVFRTCGRDDEQGAVAAKFLAAHAGKKIAILHDRTTYGKGLADDARQRLLAAGVKEVLYDGVDSGQKDFSAIVARIKAVGADFVYWGGLAPEAGLIVRQMRDGGARAVLVGSDAIASDDFAAAAGDAAQGTLMTFSIDPRSRPEAANVMKEFKASGVNPETYTLYAYAAVEVMRQAAQAAHSLDPAAMAKAMHSGMQFKTVLGEISYDARGDVTQPDYVMFVWKKEADGAIGYDRLEQ